MDDKANVVDFNKSKKRLKSLQKQKQAEPGDQDKPFPVAKFLLGLVIFLGSTVLFFEIYNRSTGQSLPSLSNAQIPKSSINASGEKEVTLLPNKQHHYVFEGSINGKRVVFLLDTGATDVSIPAKLQKHLGLTQGKTVYHSTANGVTKGYRTVVDTIQVGNIKLNSVRGSLATNMAGDEILLGMSFLKKVKMLQADGKIKLIK